MAILVTGGAGFIGRHLIETLLLARSEPIILLDNFNDFYDPAIKRANAAAVARDQRVTIVEGDFCDAAIVERVFAEHPIDHVMHLGAYAGVRASLERPALYAHVNVGGTVTLLEEARKHALQRFVLVSSSTVYGYEAGTPFREDRPLGVPLSPYGASKRAAEIYSLTYRNRYNVPVVCVRPFSVYGPGMRPDLALAIFARAIHEGRPLPLHGDGGARRDFTHVKDICSGLYAALTMPNVEGLEINLGHEHPVAMSRVIELLEQNLGRKAKIERRPFPTEDMPTTCADLTRARRVLGYEPVMEFEEGVKEYVEWYLSETR